MSTTQGKEARHGESATIAREAARETADKIRMDSCGYYDLDLLLERAFQSTIDKATEPFVKALQDLEDIIGVNCTPYVQAKCHEIFAPFLHESRAAQPLATASLRQEWTREYVDGLIRAKWSLPLGQVVADAHNATLK
jgi:hypothetical protein